MVHSCTDTQPLLPRFCSTPPQSIRRTLGCVHQITVQIFAFPHHAKSPACWAKLLHVHLPISDHLQVFWLPQGILASSPLWERNWNFRRKSRNSKTWLIFHCLARKDNGLSPLRYAKGEIKALVDTVGIADKEGSIQPFRAVSVCKSHAW